MEPKFVDQCQNWPSPCILRDLHLCHLSKAFLAKRATSQTDQSARAKLENVYYGSNWSFIWKSKKTIYYKISRWCHYQSDLENPNSAANNKITFYLCSNSKLSFPSFLHFTKINLFKSYEKCFLFQLNGSFGTCNIGILEGKYKFKKWNNYDISKWIAYITNFNFWKNSKTSLRLSDQKWSDDGPQKKQLLNIFGTLKSCSWQFLRLSSKTKNVLRFSEDFW